MSWVQAGSVSQLQEKGSLVFRHEDKQVVMFWLEGQIFALDNRCPHQGYPLQQGTTQASSCVLTCQWHNWKFDMKTGKCLVGEDHVRTYPSEVKGGDVWLDLSPPSAEEQQATILEGLRTAVAKQQYGRMSREITRLAVAGLNPVVALERTLEWTYQQFEYGTTHAVAAAADWLLRYHELDGDLEQQLVCLTEAIDHLAFDSLRHPNYEFTRNSQPFEGTLFLEAIEAEDEDQAVALVRGALESGMVWADLEYWFSKAALAHYNDFGHSLIYVQKVGFLLEHLSLSSPAVLLLPLVRSFCYSTREDLLPDFRKYAENLADTPILSEEELRSLEDTGRALSQDDRDKLSRASIQEALRWMSSRFGCVSSHELYYAALEVVANVLLHYDTSYQDAYDRPVKQNIGWLHCTHALTFANAVRALAEKHPALWREGLLQVACFVGRNQPYVDWEQDVSAWTEETNESFWEESWEHILDHGILPPIFSAHHVKTWCAVREEIELLPGHLSERVSPWLLSSLRRFLHTPLKQKHTRRAARQSLALVQGS
ncbi:MAG: Rieske (2Fe-2S) protein [Deltaproteobacteria bacterium]|nr:MAG: Rieske (2Fe-2S) protein [Deltaproteobacteria bacterium]